MQDRMYELARELLRRARAGNLEWQESGYPASYKVFFPDVALTISCGPKSTSVFETEKTYYESCQLDLMGEAGKTVGSLLTTFNLYGGATDQEEEEMHLVLTEIFDLAAAQVQDRSINKALEYLRRE